MSTTHVVPDCMFVDNNALQLLTDMKFHLQFRDAVRLFIKGTEGTSGLFAQCLCGSPHVYQVVVQLQSLFLNATIMWNHQNSYSILSRTNILTSLSSNIYIPVSVQLLGI